MGVGVPPLFGVTPADCDELAPVPIAFVAFTAKVYVVPFVRPVTLYESAVDPVLIGV